MMQIRESDDYAGSMSGHQEVIAGDSFCISANLICAAPPQEDKRNTDTISRRFDDTKVAYTLTENLPPDSKAFLTASTISNTATCRSLIASEL
jgi:hypothetical protein